MGVVWWVVVIAAAVVSAVVAVWALRPPEMSDEEREARRWGP